MFNESRSHIKALRSSKLKSRARSASKNALSNAEYLEATQAVPAPPELYAHWLAVWLKNGGNIAHHRDWRDYGRTPSQKSRALGKSAMGANGLVLESISAIDYDSEAHFRVWTPTVNTDEPIPVGYGAKSMKLLVMTDKTPIAEAEYVAAGNKSTGQWGHTTVMTLGRRSLFSGWDAGINNEHDVESYPDIEDLIMKHRLSRLRSLASEAVEQAVKPHDR